MANKKPESIEKVKDVNAVDTEETKAPVPDGIDIEAIKAELRKELMEEMKREIYSEVKPKRNKAETTETPEQKAYAEEKVPYMLPYIEGEPEEVNVTVNGVTLQILRGERVEIPRKYAEVLDNQLAQHKYFRKFQKEKQEKVTEMNKA